MIYEKYYPNGWQSGDVGGTPITPEALNHIENGIKQTYSDFAPARYGLNESNGNVISVQNSGHAPLHSLKLYGKTTQNGTPTPDSPVELVSPGDDGNVAVTVRGKNLAKFVHPEYLSQYNEALRVQFDIKPSTTYTLSFIGKSGSVYYLNESYFTEGVGYFTTKDGLNSITCTTKPGIKNGYHSGNGWIVFKNGKPNTEHHFNNFMLVEGSTATEYEPYTGGSLTARTPNGLPGIPVSSGGNYTDENGQQWICDEIDFARGKYVQRVDKVVFDGTETFTPGSTTGVYRYQLILADDASASLKVYNAEQRFMCSHFQIPEKYYASADRDFGTACIYLSGSWYEVGFKLSGTDMATYAAEQYAAGNPVTLIYPINTIETDLTAEEIAQYSALHTNYPNTTIYNDEGAYMDVEYYSPISAVPMNMGSGRAGHIMTIDEQGCVNTAPKSSMPFAPAGYGLGNAIVDVSGKNLNDVSGNGFFKWSTAINSPFDWGLMQQIDCGEATTQIAYSIGHVNGYSKVTAVRKKFNWTNWGEWEYDNPPIGLGVEYRTTERWIGLPVYTCLLNLGKFPNSTTVNIPHGLAIDRCIRCAGVDYSAGSTIPRNDNVTMYMYAGNTDVTIKTDYDFSDRDAYAQLWYTKK